MTNKEVISAKAAFESLPSATIEKAFIDRSLSGAAEYDESSLKPIELITADLYIELITTPDFKEGSLSISYDRSTLKKLAIQIYKKYDDEKLNILISDQGGISNATNLW